MHIRIGAALALTVIYRGVEYAGAQPDALIAHAGCWTGPVTPAAFSPPAIFRNPAPGHWPGGFTPST